MTTVTLDGVIFSDGMFSSYGYLTPTLVNGTYYPAWQAMFVAAQADFGNYVSSASGYSASASTFATNASASATSAANSATAAAASATAATTAEIGLSTTSTSSNTIGTGAMTFTIGSGLNFTAGQFVVASYASGATNYVHGTVTSYSGTSLVLNITDIGGSGTYASWNITVSGSQGAAGSTGASGSLSYQTVTPSTGFTQTINNSTNVLLLTPAGTLATGTVTMPASPTDGLEVRICTTQEITALTVNPNSGQSLLGAPNMMFANTCVSWFYQLTGTRWIRTH